MALIVPIVRTSGDAASLVAAMQRELRAVDVTLPVVTAQTMAQKLESAQAAPKVIATLFGALGGLGLVLVMLVMRAGSGSADIGIGNLTVYRPSIDSLALLTIAAVTALVGIAAAFVPGRRAALIDPLVALRHD
jgi:hypothetical protein